LKILGFAAEPRNTGYHNGWFINHLSLSLWACQAPLIAPKIHDTVLNLWVDFPPGRTQT